MKRGKKRIEARNKRGLKLAIIVIVILIVLFVVFAFVNKKFRAQDEEGLATISTSWNIMDYLKYLFGFTPTAPAFQIPQLPTPVIVPLTPPDSCTIDSDCGPLYEMPVSTPKCVGNSVVQDFIKKVCVNKRCVDSSPYSKRTACSGDTPYCLNGWCVECRDYKDCGNGKLWEKTSEKCITKVGTSVPIVIPYGSLVDMVCVNIVPYDYRLREGFYSIEIKRNSCIFGKCSTMTETSTEMCPGDWSWIWRGTRYSEDPVCNGGNLCVGSCWSNGNCRSDEICSGAQLPPDKKPFPGKCIRNPLTALILFADCRGCPGLSVCSNEINGMSCCRPENSKVCPVLSFNNPVCVNINPGSNTGVSPTTNVPPINPSV